MMRLRSIFSIVALMCLFCGLAMFVPALVEFYYHHGHVGTIFFSSGIFVCSISSLLYWLIRPVDSTTLKVKEMFLTTTFVWLAFALCGSLPFFLVLHPISGIDAFFESMSGLTTTGATVLTGLDSMSPGLLMWRALLQWIGGIGIIIVVLMVLPVLGMGGMQFFATEFSGKNVRETPTARQTLSLIMAGFCGLTALCLLSLKWAGMNWFDATIHAMTTVATGGFSTHDNSIAFYDSAIIEWVILFFMFVSGLPLIIWGQIFYRRWFLLRQHVQIKTYIQFIVVGVALLLFGRWLQGIYITPSIFRHTLFAVVSMITSTGFIVSDYSLWGPFAVLFFLIMMNVGACTGSTSGGIKMFRFSILWREIVGRLRVLIQPHAIVVPHYGHRPITNDIAVGVLYFLGLYFIIGIVCALVLTLCSLDLMTSVSASFSALGNIGPGLGDVIGPNGHFASLPNCAKILLTIEMLLGRLELTAVIVLFFPLLWRRNA